MTPCELFQLIAETVWDKVSRNHARGNRLSEEGITRSDIIGVIQDYVFNNKTTNIFAQKSINEVQRGADLEMYLEQENRKYLRILLQAKLLEPDGFYKDLDRFAGSTQNRQYDVLEFYARKTKSMSFYLMYNGLLGYTYNGLDCAGKYNEKQLGCTVVKPSEIKKHCEQNQTGRVDFEINNTPLGLPWRFLTCCKPGFQTNLRLYSAEDIDKDRYFDDLFFQKTIPEYKLPETSVIELENEAIHQRGWSPAARIIVSKRNFEDKPRQLILQ